MVRAQDLVGHGGPVRALAVLPDGELASAGFDAAIIWWDAARGRARRLARWHAGAVNTLAILPKGEWGGELASAGEDGRVAIWPAGGAEAPRRVLEGHAAAVTALAASAQGMLASADWDGVVRVWAADGSARVLRGHAGPVTGLVWAADGTLVSAGQDGRLLAWGPGREPRPLAEFGLPRTALIVLPGGEWGGGLAVGGAEGRVQLRLPGGATLDLEAGDRPVTALAASPDGRRLAAGTAAGAVTLWALPEARLLYRLDGPRAAVWSLAFAADGATLWSGGQDRVVRHWDAATGRALGPLAPGLAEPALADEGAWQFRACAACHSLGPDTAPMAGPTLHHLFGRRMGRVPGYAYSARLARGDVVWTRETLARLFTEGPEAMLPGTRMPLQRLTNPADMAALLRFLETATR